MEPLVYRRTDPDNFYIKPEDLERCCSLGLDRAAPARTRNTFSLGKLSDLPPELFQQVLDYMDLESVMTFRQVCWSARSAMDSSRKYRSLVRHHPQVLRALISTKLAKWFSVPTIYEAVTSLTCRTCGDYGPLIYLLACHRVCRLCVGHEDAYFAISPAGARKAFGLKPAHIAQLPVLRSLPGRYAECQLLERRARSLVDIGAALQKAVEVYGSIERTQVFARAKKALLKQRSGRERETTPPFLTTNVSTTGFLTRLDSKGGNTYRYLATIYAPYWDTAHEVREWGLACVGCARLEKPSGPFDWRRIFTREGILEHLKKECLPSQFPNLEHLTVQTLSAVQPSHWRNAQPLRAIVSPHNDAGVPLGQRQHQIRFV